MIRCECVDLLYQRIVVSLLFFSGIGPSCLSVVAHVPLMNQLEELELYEYVVIQHVVMRQALPFCLFTIIPALDVCAVSRSLCICGGQVSSRFNEWRHKGQLDLLEDLNYFVLCLNSFLEARLNKRC